MRNLGLGAIATAALIIAITALACSLSAEIATPAGASAPASTAPIWAAFITGAATTIGVVLTLGYNGRAARKAQQITAETEQRQRRRELALKIIDTLASDRKAARRFAIGLLKIEHITNGAESDLTGKVYFIPANSRVTAGRDEDNDIHLDDPELAAGARFLSRFQCGFTADQSDVFIEDFGSTNGTLVSSVTGDTCIDVAGTEMMFASVRHQKLKDGDRICIRPFVLRFVKLQENKILE